MEANEFATLEPLLTTEDVAKVLHLSTRTVRRLIQTGELPSLTIFAARRVTKDDLIAFIRARQTSTRTAVPA